MWAVTRLILLVMGFWWEHGKSLSKNQWLSKFPLEQEQNPGCEVKSKYLPLEFSSALTSRLISSCRSHGVTVHSAVTTVLGICVAEMLQDGHVKQDVEVLQALRCQFPDVLGD